MYLNIQWKINLLRLIMFMYGYILLCIHIVNHGRYQTLISSPISPPFCSVFLEDYSVGINLVLHTSVHFFKITGLD